MDNAAVDKPFNFDALFWHTKHVLERDPMLSLGLGVPGLFQVPKRGEAPETTFSIQHSGHKGYVEGLPNGLQSECNTFMPVVRKPELMELLCGLERDLISWEIENPTEAVHKTSGLLRFLRKANPAMDSKKRARWFNNILREDCSLRSLATEDEIPVQQTPKTAKSLSPIIDMFVEKRFACPRAAWYFKVMTLRQVWKGAQSSRRSGGGGGSVTGAKTSGSGGAKQRGGDGVILELSLDANMMRRDWTTQAMDYMISKLWDIAEYHGGGGSSMCVVNATKVQQWEDAFQLFCWQYESGLLLRPAFLATLLMMIQRMRDPAGLRTKLGPKPPLPLSLCFLLLSKVLLFVEDLVGCNHLYELWRVCADLRRQLMFVGSHSPNSIFFDRDYERLCKLLDYGLNCAARVAPSQVRRWGSLAGTEDDPMSPDQPPASNNSPSPYPNILKSPSPTNSDAVAHSAFYLHKPERQLIFSPSTICVARQGQVLVTSLTPVVHFESESTVNQDKRKKSSLHRHDSLTAVLSSRGGNTGHTQASSSTTSDNHNRIQNSHIQQQQQQHDDMSSTKASVGSVGQGSTPATTSRETSISPLHSHHAQQQHQQQQRQQHHQPQSRRGATTSRSRAGSVSSHRGTPGTSTGGRGGGNGSIGLRGGGAPVRGVLNKTVLVNNPGFEDPWLQLEAVSNTAAVGRLLLNARRVRRTGRFRITPVETADE